MLEQNCLRLKRESSIVSGRNLQRVVIGDINQHRKIREKEVMNSLLRHELTLFNQMGLVNEPLEEIKANPDLTTFLDGPDGLGGYADVYAQQEYMAPGTKLEMDLEKKAIAKHLLSILSPGYLDNLKATNKPLVIVEGGAGPDLRTFETVCSVLSEKKADLKDIPIKIVITDISKRMAAITTSKLRTSGLIDPDLNVETAVLAADVFDLIEKLSKESLTYALLPFGVMSFGLDGKDVGQLLKTINNKIIPGGGILATVYHTGWLDYSRGVVQLVGENQAPFVINIIDGKMQVAGGLAFNCRTFYPEELAAEMQWAKLEVNDSIVTPQGWAYWPKDILAKAVEGRVCPEGCAALPPSSLMDEVKSHILSNLGISNTALIPDGKQMKNYPAPYITVTAQKPVNN